MKHSKAPIPTGTDERPLRFWDFIRAAAVVSVCVTVALPVLFVPGVILYVDYGKTEVLYIAPFLWFLSVLAIWVGTLSVGCLVMFPLWDLEALQAARPTRCWEDHSRRNALGSVD